MASKYIKFGNIIKTKNGKFALALGNDRNKNKKYNYSVEFTVLDSENKPIYKQKNGFLNLFDPRQRPNASEEDVAKIPEQLKFEVMAINNESEE